MDAASALADLTEISSQVEAAVVVDGDGAVLASTLTPEAGTERLVRAGLDLLEAAESRFGGGARGVTQLEVALHEGSVFVVREEGLGMVARTSANPSSGLVVYDLRTCLRSVAQGSTKQGSTKQGSTKQAPKPPRRAAKKKQEPADA